MAKKTTDKRSKNKKKNSLHKDSLFNEVLRSMQTDKFRFIVGLLLLFFALYMLTAFTSYIFTGKADQSVMDAAGKASDYVNITGKQGASIAEWLINRAFGISAYCIALLIGVIGLHLMNIRKFNLVRWTIICCSLLVWGSVFFNFAFGKSLDRLGFYIGGYHGKFITDTLTDHIGQPGVLLALFVTAILFSIYLTSDTIDFIRNLFHPSHILTEDEENSAEESLSVSVESEEEIPFDINSGDTCDNIPDTIQEPEKLETLNDALPQSKDDEPGFEVQAAKETETVDEVEQPYDPKLDLSRYKYPTLDLLNQTGEGAIAIDRQEQESNKNRIIEVLRSFGIEISSINATVGPTITLYEITPAPGVKIARIKNLEEDIALNLKALGIRIIAPMPGRGTIGIEVPNRKAQTVSMYSVIASRKFQECDYALPVAIGKTITNEVFTFDLAKAPHLLVAGATGQGKSVGLNAIITSLLYKKHPAELKLVLVDPKKVELSIYNSIDHHFLAKLEDEEEAIITDTEKVVKTLKSLCQEMDERYNLLKAAGVRGIKDYNELFKNRRLNPQHGHRFLPYIVVVIDEYGDLIMTAGKAVELPICRIAQLARAVGIHMIIATQRPTANIITGTIKANFPTRIAFKVMSPVDSRVILERTGANSLVGRGDMLYVGAGDPVRIQCAFVDTPEVVAIGEYIQHQQGYPEVFPLPEVFEEGDGGSSEALDTGKLDALFEEAAQLVVSRQQGSTSTIQRQFAIGYNRAGRIMDQLEQAGIVGPAQGSKPRQVLVTDLIDLETRLENMKKQ